jgi:hypothetical protein
MRKGEKEMVQFPSSTMQEALETTKTRRRISGPYRVLPTLVNGTVTLELRPEVSERLNIWRVDHTKNEC